MRQFSRPRHLGAGALVLAALTLPAAAETSVIGVAITVRDLDPSIDFYTEVLDFELVSRRHVDGDAAAHLYGLFGLTMETATLRLGEETITLVDTLTPEGRDYPADMASNDHWFQHIAIIVSDMDAAYARLAAAGVEHVSPGPQVLPDWNPAAGGIAAFYFRDPDGNTLEILSFPPDKGEARWQADDRLFLGIDHTAIVVDDTETSLAFWQDALGFSVVGTSENYGPEQERLNAVFAARLQISALRAPGGGMAVEFLEYLSPSPGRSTPADSTAADLWHWQVIVESDGLEEDVDAARRAGGQWVSPGVVGGLPEALGGPDGALVLDPDGHGVLLLGDLPD